MIRMNDVWQRFLRRSLGWLPGCARSREGQATTETVLMLPVFIFFLYAFAKIFAALILVQKMEIASYYAARRWQLESHRNYMYIAHDEGVLASDIKQKVAEYLGYGTPIGQFLDLKDAAPVLTIERTQVWQVVYLRVETEPVMVSWMYKSKGYIFEITKYVPNRDRPIAFELPGMN